MRKHCMILVVFALASNVFAQYAGSPVVESVNTSPANASSRLVYNLDSTQASHAGILPLRVIQTPTYANIPDTATYAVIAQPSDSDSCALASNTVAMPSTLISGNALCGVRISTTWAASTFTSYASAKSAYDGLSTGIKQFAILVPTVATNAPWLLIFPATSSFCN
jgi:hypothetical protein